MTLPEKYQQAISLALRLLMEGTSIEESGGRLQIKGTVQSVEDKNRIWNAIKSVAGWENEVMADIRVSEAGMAAWQSAGSGSQAATTTYTVKSGDTLGKIARDHLGDANAYMEIFNANSDQLTDPDKIKPGQVLRLP